MTCPDCGHPPASSRFDWTGPVERGLRRLFRRPPAPVRLRECAHGSSYDADGCACTHPIHT